MHSNHQEMRGHHDSNHLQQQLRRTEEEEQQQQQQLEEQQQINLQGASISRMEYPPGYRFCPTDEELIMLYLRPKVANLPLPFDGIPTLDINKHYPESIKDSCKWSKLFKTNEMYFFTPRTRKYANGTRPNRAAAKGYWKPTGNEKPITDGGEAIGYKKQLDFYTGHPKDCKRTSWKMHEYRTDQTGSAPNRNANGEMNMQLDRYVLCKMYLSKREKGDGDGNSNSNGEEEDVGESIMNADDSDQTTVQTNEALVQNQNNYLGVSGTSTASAFALSSTFEPRSLVQMYSENSSFIDQRETGNSIMDASNYGQIVHQTNEAVINNLVVSPATSTSHHAFAWPVTHEPSSSSQMFDQNSSFINQILGKRSFNEYARDSIMNANNSGQTTVQINEVAHNSAPSTSHAFSWPLSHSAQVFDQNSSFIDQSWRNSFQMFDQNSSLMDLSSGFNDNFFSAMENFPPTTSAAHEEPNYHPLMAATDFDDPFMYMKPIGDINEVDQLDVVKDDKQPSIKCPSNSKRQ